MPSNKIWILEEFIDDSDDLLNDSVNNSESRIFFFIRVCKVKKSIFENKISLFNIN